MILQQLDSYSYRQVNNVPNAWNHIRYSVNARLEFELVRLAQQLPREEILERFKLKPASDQSIVADWSQFNGVYIPACFLELRTNPENCLPPEQIEFFKRRMPVEYADRTVFSGLFARDDGNYLGTTLEEKNSRRTLGEIVLGGAGGISSVEKIRKLFEDEQWKLYAAEFTRTILETASRRFHEKKADYTDPTLRDLIGMLIVRYQKEIGNPQNI